MAPALPRILSALKLSEGVAKVRGLPMMKTSIIYTADLNQPLFFNLLAKRQVPPCKGRSELPVASTITADCGPAAGHRVSCDLDPCRVRVSSAVYDVLTTRTRGLAPNIPENRKLAESAGGARQWLDLCVTCPATFRRRVLPFCMRKRNCSSKTWSLGYGLGRGSTVV